MKGLPGRDSLAPNIGPPGLINLCIMHPESMSEEEWLGVWEILKYRLGAIRAAEIPAYRLGLRVLRASEWDKEAWIFDKRDSEVYQLACEYSKLFARPVYFHHHMDLGDGTISHIGILRPLVRRVGCRRRRCRLASRLLKRVSGQ